MEKIEKIDYTNEDKIPLCKIIRRNKMKKRFDYIKYDEISTALQNELKEVFTNILSKLTDSLSESREKDLALNHLEETWMWVGKSLKISQEHREMIEESSKMMQNDDDEPDMRRKRDGE